MQVNGRSVEIQLMRKLQTSRFVWDVNFLDKFQDTFLPFFSQERTESVEGLIVRNATKLVKSACCLTLGDIQWSDLSLVGFPNSFKHFVFSVDELRTLLECYKTLYPGQLVEVTSNIARKYSNVKLGTEKFGSKMDCRNLRSARIMASWTGDDGSIDFTSAKRPGFVLFYFMHSVKINDQCHQHAFAVVWWYQADQEKDYYGKPVLVWKKRYAPCGPALFVPVQRIAQRFACSLAELSGEEKLVVSPIPRSFH